MISNTKIYDKDKHLKIFGEIVKLCINKYEMEGFQLEINSITGEIIWSRKGLDVYATPFILGNEISFHIVNDYYIEKESISLSKVKDLPLQELVELYLKIVRNKFFEWRLVVK